MGADEAGTARGAAGARNRKCLMKCCYACSVIAAEGRKKQP
jgi:hypothetical protein